MIALTFPGQGSQRPGMGQPWVDTPGWPLVEQVSDLLGCDLAALLLRADADELKAPWTAQITTFLTSLVALGMLEPLAGEVGAVAGHSLGEYTALVAAGVLCLTDGVALVDERGKAMAAAARQQPGTMAAVLGLDDAEVEDICAGMGAGMRAGMGQVWPANYNAPGHVVVSGTVDGVTAAGEAARAAGARRILPIPVGGAYHTPLMAPARSRLEAALATAAYQDPAMPVVANVDAFAHSAGTDWPALLSAQLTSPVRWRQSLATLAYLDVDTLVEVGPGGVLTGLARRALPAVRAISVATPADLPAVRQRDSP